MKLSVKINIKVYFLLISFVIFHLLLVCWISFFFRFTFSRTGGLKIVQAEGEKVQVFFFFWKGCIFVGRLSVPYYMPCHDHQVWLFFIHSHEELKIDFWCYYSTINKNLKFNKTKKQDHYQKSAANPVKKEVHYFAIYVWS